MPNSAVLESIFGTPSIAADILVLDSNEYILGFTDPQSDSAALLKALKECVVVVPAMVVEEVTSSLAAISHRLKSDAFEVADASTMLQKLREGKVALV